MISHSFSYYQLDSPVTCLGFTTQIRILTESSVSVQMICAPSRSLELKSLKSSGETHEHFDNLTPILMAPQPHDGYSPSLNLHERPETSQRTLSRTWFIRHAFHIYLYKYYTCICGSYIHMCNTKVKPCKLA